MRPRKLSRRLREFRKRQVLRLASRSAAHTHASRFADVERFCLFLGSARSGSTLVSQLLNAHRHAVISFEIDALLHLKKGATRDQLFARILTADRRFGAASGLLGGYDYHIPGQWQGSIERLRVVGDKRAGVTTSRLGRHPELLDALRVTVGVPLSVINVIRNPFDNITTMARRGSSSLESAASAYFAGAEVVSAVRAELDPEELIEIHLEALVADPSGELTQLCDRLGLDAPPDYCSACAALVFPTHKRTRTDALWTPEVIADVERAMCEHEFFAGYAYEDDELHG